MFSPGTALREQARAAGFAVVIVGAWLPVMPTVTVRSDEVMAAPSVAVSRNT